MAQENTLTEAITYCDFKGLQCPLPVLKTRKKLQSLAACSLLKIETTDPLSPLDIAHFCLTDGHELVEQRAEDRIFHFLIRKR
ncbi:sulfurtransferase TusA family protein [Pseudochrobactrum sp. MP213Fo]|uniref:sulfurtransferase TusA family protein n=1 Tax=Pseudochrobactrum sp. MP213Fo TaxID=3022250 RepID=UPI003B9EE6CF